jgi:hypothetical protein
MKLATLGYFFLLILTYFVSGMVIVSTFATWWASERARAYLKINGDWKGLKKHERKNDAALYDHFHLCYDRFYPQDAPDYQKFRIAITKTRAMYALGIKWICVGIVLTMRTLYFLIATGTIYPLYDYWYDMKAVTEILLVIPGICLTIFEIGVRCKLRRAKRKERKKANADILLCDDSNIHSELHLHPETDKPQLGDNQKRIRKTKVSKQTIAEKERKEKKIASTTRPAPYILIHPGGETSAVGMVAVIIFSGIGIYFLHIGDIENAVKMALCLIPSMILNLYPLIYTVTIYRNEVYRTLFLKFTKKWTLDDISYFSIHCLRDEHGPTPIIFVHMKGHIFWSFYVSADHFGYDLFWHSIRSSNKDRIVDVPIRGEHKIEKIEFWRDFW